MSTQVQYRRGSNVQVAAFTGALGEIVVDTTNKVLVVNDGITAGGFPQVGLTAAQTLTNKIYNGTSVSVTGNITATGATINGDLTVTGNATLSGNIVGDRIVNGTTNIEIQTTNGNANITVAGTTNVAVFTSSGVLITGTSSVSGNVTGGNILTAGLVSATSTITSAANVTGGNLVTAGLITATGNIQGNFFIGNGSQLTGIDATAIQNGTANVRTFLNGNVTTSAGGTANVLNVTSTGAIITGDLSVTGNATLSGNILGDRIQNGTTIIDIQVANGNANVSVGGTSNVAVFATTGLFVTGVNSVSGNITGSNLLTAGLISATGNITGGNILGGANVNATTHTGTTVSVTANITGGNILTGGLISATGNITGNFILGNGSQLTGIDATSIQSGTSNVRVVSSGGNVAMGIGGTANVVVVATTGQFVTGVSSASGNVTGGNILTAGLVSATGAITGAALTGTSLTVSTGNITGGNLLLSGAIVDSAQLDIQTSASNANIALAPNGTGVVTVSTQVSAVGNVTGGNLLTGGLISATSTITSAANVIGGNISTAGLITATGNIQGGNLRTAGLISATGAITGAAITGTSLTVSTGNITCGNIVNANGNGVGNIGSASLYFNTVFAKATSAQYADLAEMYSSEAQYDPGTVVVFGGNYEVEISLTSHATTVAGVVSTNPSYVMNAGQQGLHVVPVALQGRVPTRVVGRIRKGDRMVSSHIPGVATVLDPAQYDPGCIIGKALVGHEPMLDNQGNEVPGIIEIVVGRV